MGRITKEAGFTLLELMIVVVIIGIGAAVSTFSIRTMLPDLRLKAAVRDLKSNMTMARMQAIRENSNVVLLFDSDANTYTVFIDDGAGGGIVGNNIREGAEILVKTVAIPDRVEMYEANYSAATLMSFNGRGLPNGFGHVYLRNAENKYRGIITNIIGKTRISESTDGGVTWP